MTLFHIYQVYIWFMIFFSTQIFWVFSLTELSILTLCCMLKCLYSFTTF